MSGDPGRTVADDIPRDRLNGRSYEAFIGDFPLPESDRQALIALHTVKKDYLPEMTLEQKVEWLDTHSYHPVPAREGGPE